ncbi:alpha/beta hydrolase [Algoriphagus resistens]|uniref:alpha/beta hydrolase n=1 Tax=Algoriphagus resistens TaxID=1750590 RepID=UPI0007168BC4|nr:alpha/beta hydrolase [Algoriphagus resistens]
MKIPLFRNSILHFLVICVFWGCSADPDEGPIRTLEKKTELNLPYGTAANQLLDIYLPAERSVETTRLLLYIHGGAWINGSKEEFVGFRKSMEGIFPDYAFASINYSLYDFESGSNKFPAQENDVLDAINFVISKSSEWNISDRIVLAGASAGGHLALLHAYKHQEIGNIQAVIAFFPPTDLAALYNISPITTQVGLQGLVGGTPQSDPDAFAASSPIHFVDEESVPTIFFHGTLDRIVPISQSESLAGSLKSAGVNYKFTIVPDQGHGFQEAIYPPLLQEAALFLENNKQ